MNKKGLFIKVGVIGAIAATATTFTACSGIMGLGEDKSTETVSETAKPTTVTSATTSVTETTTTTRETETTKSAGLDHEGTENIPKDDTYIISGSDSRYLSEDDLDGFDAENLRLARNEIYARHGNIFKDEKLQNYFSKKSWYKPNVKSDDFNESVFNDYEKKNVYFIKKLEDELSGKDKNDNENGSKEISEKDKVLKSIEGNWTTVGNSGLIHKVFKGDTLTDSNGSSKRVTDVKRFSNADGEGYKIYLDSGTIYYLFDYDAKYLECHWEPDGPNDYSGSDSLVRE